MREMTESARMDMDAAQQVAELTGIDRFDVCVVLGSGWGLNAELIGKQVASVPTASLPGMHAPAVAGHAGQVLALDCDGVRTLAFSGRTHLYEGHGVAPVIAPVMLAAALGCRSAILTNGAGAVNPAFEPGQVVSLSDHINHTGASALVGPRFVDMSNVYSGRLRALARPLVDHEGVYQANHGPAYETPAEVRAAAAWGADLVGMSTVLEATAAVSAGLEVLGLSLVTNMAAGLSSSLNHEEVLAAGRSRGEHLGGLLATLVRSA